MPESPVITRWLASRPQPPEGALSTAVSDQISQALINAAELYWVAETLHDESATGNAVDAATMLLRRHAGTALSARQSPWKTDCYRAVSEVAACNGYSSVVDALKPWDDEAIWSKPAAMRELARALNYTADDFAESLIRSTAVDPEMTVDDVQDLVAGLSIELNMHERAFAMGAPDALASMLGR